jgi:hypothetical protein
VPNIQNNKSELWIGKLNLRARIKGKEINKQRVNKSVILSYCGGL